MLLNDKVLKFEGPIVSVIIASLRDDEALAMTVDSCLAQSGINLEIVTFIHNPDYEVTAPLVEIQQVNDKKLVKLHGNDSGIAEAWNAAVRLASGNFVVFLGAGDVFFSVNSLSKILEMAPPESLKDKSTVIIGLQFIRGSEGNLKPWVPCGNPEDGGLSRGMAIPHASSLWPRKLWDLDEFNQKFKIALDYEYALRVREKVKYMVIASQVAIIEPGGLSNTPSRLIDVVFEDINARKINGLPAGYFSIINFKRLIKWAVGKFA
ncbi:glycosyltransferase [Chromobacterium haemolyticum]|uniref:glycosyltransferase n=1 Tax=Chromobacterium haemolyticum TaxID=394935 RepID=UPI004057239D